MKIEAITQAKLYELAIQHKQHQEDRRDNINSYYISLFSAIVAVMPFINKVNESYTHHEFYIVKLSLLALSLVGFVLSTTWWLNLKRILLYLQAVDKFLITSEKAQDVTFIKYITEQLNEAKAPDRITKTQFVLPSTFMLIFITSLIYFLWSILG